MRKRFRISGSTRRRCGPSQKLPHRDVYARIARSKIHGVGVKAIRKIPKGMSIFPDDNDSIIWIKENKIKGLSSEVRRLYTDFCIIRAHDGKYGCPRSFNRLTVAWYLNRPESGQRPNVGCRRDYTFYALRDIEPGEELTVDYRTFSDPLRIDSKAKSEKAKPFRWMQKTAR